MTDDENKNSNPDFEDDIFDEASFDESYYEDDAVYDEADIQEDDAAFDEVDFDETDWDEEESEPLAGKRAKSLYTSDKKPFLNFNTIVIIGAFVVGAGVLAFTVMGKSGSSSGMMPKFISSLNISDVMDGGLFGLGGEDDTAPENTLATDVTDQPAVQETGFLDDPDALELQATDNSDLPPQPSPISPAEIDTNADTALTPMPEIIADDPVDIGGNVPRGPDGMVSATGNEEVTPDDVASVPAMPEAAPQPSAEDILKRALANRGQKQQDDVVAQAVPDEKEAEISASVAEPVPTPELVAEPTVVPTPVATPVPPPVDVPPPAPVVSAASDESIKSLEGKLDAMLKRMEQIETELSNVREGRESEYENLQKTVTSLKSDIGALKNAPAPKAPAAATPRPAEPAKKVEPKKDPAPAKAAAPAKRAEPAYSPPPKPAAPPAQSANWELRAAQPGKAWVSKTGQRDMQGVVVGDTVPGLGRITAISYENGRWMVSGTQGQIRQ